MDTISAFVDQYWWAFAVLAAVIFLAYHFHVVGQLKTLLKHGHAPVGTVNVPADVAAKIQNPAPTTDVPEQWRK